MSEPTTDYDGTITYRLLDGLRHREDGPAVIYTNGDKQWWLYGYRHRDNDLPAIELINGQQEWYINGKRHREHGYAFKDNERRMWWANGYQHRENGPAVEWDNGHQEWWFRGKKHRLDGPAQINANGSKYWYRHNKLHREDGPAIEYFGGLAEYHFNGQFIACTKNEFDRFLFSKDIL